MLKATMGAEGAFERRQFELKTLGRPHTDEDVVSSFRNSVDPSHRDNFMLRYMQNAQLAYVFGKTIFVHGGVTRTNMGRLPNSETPAKNVHEWVKQLNTWVTAELKEYVQDYDKPFTFSPSFEKRPANKLMDYCVPGGNHGATVVYTGYVEKGLPTPEGKEVEEFLLKSGISTVAVGHQPVGDCPGVIRSPIIIVNGDSSYATSQRLGSPLQREWGPDNRGDAVSEIMFHRDTGEVKVSGTLADGVHFEYDIGDRDPCVGKVVDGQWIKALIEAVTPEYLLAKPGRGMTSNILAFLLSNLQPNYNLVMLKTPKSCS